MLPHRPRPLQVGIPSKGSVLRQVGQGVGIVYAAAGGSHVLHGHGILRYAADIIGLPLFHALPQQQKRLRPRFQNGFQFPLGLPVHRLPALAGIDVGGPAPEIVLPAPVGLQTQSHPARVGGSASQKIHILRRARPCPAVPPGEKGGKVSPAGPVDDRLTKVGGPKGLGSTLGGKVLGHSPQNQQGTEKDRGPYPGSPRRVPTVCEGGQSEGKPHREKPRHGKAVRGLRHADGWQDRQKHP